MSAHLLNLSLNSLAVNLGQFTWSCEPQVFQSAESETNTICPPGWGKKDALCPGTWHVMFACWPFSPRRPSLWSVDLNPIQLMTHQPEADLGRRSWLWGTIPTPACGLHCWFSRQQLLPGFLFPAHFLLQKLKILNIAFPRRLCGYQGVTWPSLANEMTEVPLSSLWPLGGFREITISPSQRWEAVGKALFLLTCGCRHVKTLGAEPRSGLALRVCGQCSHFEGPCAWGFMLSSCCIKILHNFTFEFLFRKWSLMGQWSMSWRTRFSLGFPHSHGLPRGVSQLPAPHLLLLQAPAGHQISVHGWGRGAQECPVAGQDPHHPQALMTKHGIYSK